MLGKIIIATMMMRQTSIVCKDEAHEWADKNHYLFTGYRVNFSSLSLSVQSLFIRHNELMNIWTHLVAAVIFFFLLVFVRVKFPVLITLQISKDLEAVNPMFTEAWNAFKAKFHGLASAKDSALAGKLRSLRPAAGEDNYHDRLVSFLEEKLASADRAAWLKQLYLSDLPTYPIEIFIVSAIICYLFSAVYHLFCDMEPRISKKLRSLDYAGVSLLISGSSFSIVYYLGYCHPKIVAFYGALIFTISFAVFLVSLSHRIHEPKNLSKKSAMYAALGLSNVAPMAHILWLYTQKEATANSDFRTSVILTAASGATYLLGLYIYTRRYPERYYPRRFDIWLNSHTLWHFLGVSAAFMHFGGLVFAYRMRIEAVC